MQFKTIDSSDIPLIKPYLMTQPYRSCDYTVNTIFMWKDYFHYRYSIDHECLVIQGTSHEGNNVFAFPIGRCQIEETLRSIQECCRQNKQPLRFMTVPAAGVEILKKVFQIENLIINPVRKWFDYVYLASELAELKGNKNATHRNKVNKFMRFYPNYQFKKIQNEQDIVLVKAFVERFNEQYGNHSETGEYEVEQLQKVLDNFFTLGFLGAYLIVNEEVVAMTYGDIIDDTLYVHVEKAMRHVEGSYAMINKLFVQANIDQIQYVNREDDVDDPGLRYAKESYHPFMMIEKFNVDVIEKE